MNRTDSTQRQGWGITALRMIVGTVFLVHGWQKLFVYGFSGVAGLFGQLGIPAPMLSAVVVTAVEFLGGGALLLGLFTRWVAIPLAITMAVAVFGVHMKAGFFLPNGYEYALTLLVGNVALALTGSGEFALDNVLGRPANRDISRKAPEGQL